MNETTDPIQTQNAQTPPPYDTDAQGDSIKETIESVVIALILAFVFRAYVVEAFVIPTGSMAPTLLGQHLRVTCNQCGYQFTVDPDERSRTEQRRGLEFQANYLTRTVTVICPMCHNEIIIDRGTRISAGDRILVHKYIYSFAEPKRWDVVVFKNPQEPQVNFIKRLVGLPNERLWIIHGNLYVRSPGDADFHIARKGDRPQAQRAVWQPVYYSRYVPLDYAQRTTGPNAWHTPWVAQSGHWELQGRRSYQCMDQTGGSIIFDFNRAKPRHGSWYPYDQAKSRYLSPEPIEDVRLAAAFQPAAEGLSIALTTTARLGLHSRDAGRLPVRAAIDAKGHATLSTLDPDYNKTIVLADTQLHPLPAGETTPVELWYVDQQASMWVNHRRVLTWQYDLDFQTIRERRPPPMTPSISIEVHGSAVTLHQVQIDRDLYYSDHNQNQQARGSTHRRNGFPPRPVTLGPDHFFCMGDNSPMSSDGRYWNEPQDWIEYRLFQDWVARGNDPAGLVPRPLMMGRAFFVYFPAPYGLDPKRRGFIPNFGDMRFIH